MLPVQTGKEPTRPRMEMKMLRSDAGHALWLKVPDEPGAVSKEVLVVNGRDYLRNRYFPYASGEVPSSHDFI